MKVLFYGESPCIETGSAQVAKRILEVFQELDWHIEAVCINHIIEHYDRDKYPYHIHNVKSEEPYGKKEMREAILRGGYDLIFMSADCQNIREFDEQILYMHGQHSFKTVCYVPIDCDIINPEAFSGVVLSDIAVTATYHAQNVFRRIIPGKHVNVLYHGCEPETFYPIEPDERASIRKKLFDANDNTFVVLFAGRNQQRKDFARGMYAFHLFHQKHPNSLLYMHSKQNDVGGSLPFYAKIFGMKFETGKDEIYFTSPDYSEAIGIDRYAMNHVYNLADCYASSSTGEGWGLCMTEAMSAQCPVLVPENTSHIEIVGRDEERGYFIQCGGHDLWLLPYGFTANPRDIVSVSDMVEKLEYIYYHPEEAKEKASGAREWTKQHTWEKFKQEWKKILTAVETELTLV